jgi:hypothetical protein
LIKERIAIRPIDIVLREATAGDRGEPVVTFSIPNDFLLDAFQYVNQDPAANIVNLSVENDNLAGLENVLQNNQLLVVAAAGNDGLNVDENPRYPAAAAMRDRLITVAAHDATGKLASFSNWGKNLVDLAAPGCQIDSTLPGGKRGALSGTSQAAPLVSFTAALLYSEGLTYKQIKDRILLTTQADHVNLGVCDGPSGHCVSTEGRLDITRALEVYQDVVVLQKADGSLTDISGQIIDSCISLDGRCYSFRTALKRLVHEPHSAKGTVWINSSDNRVLPRPCLIGTKTLKFRAKGESSDRDINIDDLVDLVPATLSPKTAKTN